MLSSKPSGSLAEARLPVDHRSVWHRDPHGLQIGLRTNDQHTGLVVDWGDRTLAGIPVFTGLPARVRERAEHRCRWHVFEPGSAIVGYQDTSRDVCFIVRGHVRVVIYSSSGKAVTFREMKAGEMFGELAAIDGQARSASVEAIDACLIALMTPDVFWELVTSEPSFARAVLLHLNGLVRSLSARIFEFSTLAVQNRIHAELLRLAGEGVASGGVVVIAHPPTHSEIASRISTHREAVTRELGRLSKLGIIERRGTALKVRDIERLARMVQEALRE
jgi:CRP/FNR family cyclic AMP-dependent transcriptional regulator